MKKKLVLTAAVIAALSVASCNSKKAGQNGNDENASYTEDSALVEKDGSVKLPAVEGTYEGSTVTVMGWVAKRRNLGSLIFVDLRDRSGILQILFDENIVGKEGFDKAYTLRNEFVIAVVGKVVKRSGAVNENLKTGDIEIAAESLRILSESETPPFPIEDGINTKEDISQDSFFS